MKEWFELKSKLEEMGAISIDFEENKVHIPSKDQFMKAAGDSPLDVSERDSEDYPLQLSFEKDGLTYFCIATEEEVLEIMKEKAV